MRFVIVSVVALVVACGSPAAPQHPAAPAPARGGPKPGEPRKPPPVTGDRDPASTVVLPSIGCLAPTCAFHAGAGSYFMCLSGGAGACFHFGAACAPADGCMYDPADRTYKQCAKPVEGSCPQWGAACAPTSKCMFDPSDGSHRQCDEPAGGSCKRYGALCTP